MKWTNLTMHQMNFYPMLNVKVFDSSITHDQLESFLHFSLRHAETNKVIARLVDCSTVLTNVSYKKTKR